MLGHHHTPAHVKIGVDRENLEHFNDLVELEKAGPGPYKIRKIKGTYH